MMLPISSTVGAYQAVKHPSMGSILSCAIRYQVNLIPGCITGDRFLLLKARMKRGTYQLDILNYFHDLCDINVILSLID